MFPCPAGLKLLRDYQYDVVIDKVTGAANELNTIPKSARRVGIVFASDGGQIFVRSVSAITNVILFTYQAASNNIRCALWHDDIGPAIFGQLTFQTSAAGAGLRVWEINLPTEYRE